MCFLSHVRGGRLLPHGARGQRGDLLSELLHKAKRVVLEAVLSVLLGVFIRSSAPSEIIDDLAYGCSMGRRLRRRRARPVVGALKMPLLRSLPCSGAPTAQCAAAAPVDSTLEFKDYCVVC